MYDPACGTGGDVITFVQKFDNISFTQAVDFLKKNYPRQRSCTGQVMFFNKK